MAKNNIQSIRGMHDILPQDMPYWHFLESTVRDLFTRYGYHEIRMPLVEETNLFKRAVGEVTDIVEKEMYTFVDREKLSLSLRPEGTASCVRAGIQNGLLHNQQQRLWYHGPMFRHERPQKGRLRQFYQFGVETFGIAGADVDAELIAMTARLWQALGLKNIRLELNSLGTPESRAQYRRLLVDYFSQYSDQLDEDSQRRLHSNPLRILDSKNPAMAEIITNAPSLSDHLDEASAQHFAALTSMLDAMHIEYSINPRLVRGLDYYSRTVFEWVTDELGAQGTVCAGGRYDGLIEQLGGKATPGCGFAMGIERLVLLLQEQNVSITANNLDIYLVTNETTLQQGMVIAEQLRSDCPHLNIQLHCGGGKFKSQMKKADASGARFALILGEDEVAQQQITLKNLREHTEQQSLALDNLSQTLPALMTQ